jgi:hypothetical protein
MGVLEDRSENNKKGNKMKIWFIVNIEETVCGAATWIQEDKGFFLTEQEGLNELEKFNRFTSKRSSYNLICLEQNKGN